MRIFKSKTWKNESGSRNPGNRSNRSILHISYAVTGLFAAMIVYFLYFVFVGSQNVIGSTYNPRTDSFAERIVRGPIMSSDGYVLSETVRDETGNESRVYPQGELFCHLTGYTSRGKTGMESFGNFYLLSSHINLIEQLENDLRGEKSLGDSIYLTSSYELQKAASEALGDRRGAVIAMEPATGRILCMVSKPGFDPNTIAEDWEEINSTGKDEGRLLNRALQGAYPPGSTFKIFTALEYMNEHPDDYEDFRFVCTGEYRDSEGNTISCYGGEAHGEQGLYEAFANSCNGAFAEIGGELDPESMTGLLEKLLFNSKLPIDMPYTQSRYALSSSDTEFLKALTAIGQGNTLVSPGHMLLVTSAIANDGVLMRPEFIQRVESAGGETVKTFREKEYGRLLKTEDAERLGEMMRLVVTEGTGSAFRDTPYEAYVKTGSAEYENGEKTHAWCLSFVKPDSESGSSGIAVAVTVEDGVSGGRTAAPVARAVTDAWYQSAKN